VEEEREARLESLFEADLEVGILSFRCVCFEQSCIPSLADRPSHLCCQQPDSRYRAQSDKAHPSVAEPGQTVLEMCKRAAEHNSIQHLHSSGHSLICTCRPERIIAHWVVPSAPMQTRPAAGRLAHKRVHLTMRQRLSPHRSSALRMPPASKLFTFPHRTAMCGEMRSPGSRRRRRTRALGPRPPAAPRPASRPRTRFRTRWRRRRRRRNGPRTLWRRVRFLVERINLHASGSAHLTT
jgi:hypothetical protein